MITEKIIEVRGLTKKFKNITAVNNLDLNVYRGDVFGFLGPNGAGKSTTIRMLLTLIRPTAGIIKIFGQSLFSNRKSILRRIGSIVEKPDFYLYLTAFKNLEILGKISRVNPKSKEIYEILELVGLKERALSKVKTFSHGMKQRLGVAQVLLHNPDLIILDEPTTGLDPEGMKEIRELIIRLSEEEGKTIFLSSHILNEIEEVATRLIIIDKGTTQVEGTVEELLNSGTLTVTFEVSEIKKSQLIINNSPWKEHIKSVINNKLLLQINKEDIPIITRLLVKNQIDINAIIPKRSLEDFFLKITESNN